MHTAAADVAARILLQAPLAGGPLGDLGVAAPSVPRVLPNSFEACLDCVPPPSDTFDRHNNGALLQSSSFQPPSQTSTTQQFSTPPWQSSTSIRTMVTFYTIVTSTTSSLQIAIGRALRAVQRPMAIPYT